MTTVNDQNEFFVSGPEQKLSERILKAIRHNRGLSESDITVAANGNEIVLSGTVRLSLQKRLAAAIARRFGYDNVRNLITVVRTNLAL